MPRQCGPTMNAADCLTEEILSLVDLLLKCATRLNNLALDLENHKRNSNICKFVSNCVTVGGVIIAAAPALGAAAKAAQVVGLAANLGTDAVNSVLSNKAMSEAKEISDSIEKARNEIQTLMKSLTEKQPRKKRKMCCGGDSDVAPEDYVVERILRAMAKRKGLKLSDKKNLTALVSVLSANLDSPLEIPTLQQFVEELVCEQHAVETAKPKNEATIKKGAAPVAGGLKMPPRVSIKKQVGQGLCTESPVKKYTLCCKSASFHIKVKDHIYCGRVVKITSCNISCTYINVVCFYTRSLPVDFKNHTTSVCSSCTDQQHSKSGQV